MPDLSPIRLDVPASHVEVTPGGEIVVSGSFKSTFDVREAILTAFSRQLDMVLGGI